MAGNQQKVTKCSPCSRKQQQWRHVFFTGMVMLLTDVPLVDGCAKLHEFSDILARLFVLSDSLVIRSLLSLILVRTI